MAIRVLIIIAASVAFGFVAGTFAVRGLGPYSGGMLGAIWGLLCSPAPAVCLRRKPLKPALLWWLGPTSLAIAILTIIAPLWLLLTLGTLTYMLAAALSCVEMPDINEPFPNRCDACGYDLTDIDAHACPECGHIRFPTQNELQRF